MLVVFFGGYSSFGGVFVSRDEVWGPGTGRTGGGD